MATNLESSRLFKWLKKLDEDLAGRLCMVRKELAKWMPRVVQVFPHYPSHSVDHSDRIVAQLSKLLFTSSKLAVSFSAGEVYCLLCAAYLHDMGMVVSDADVTIALGSAEWKAFVTEGGKGCKMFEDYQAFQNAEFDGKLEQKAFVGAAALRQIVAEFFRQGHHEHGKMSLDMHPFLKQLVDDGDPVASETISDLGVGHGLSEAELSDTTRFPEERDVLGHKVNVRFLARLLRIGDLLDMDSSRADPMTAKAASPLPPEAVPHWKQYSTKRHENITPRVIEFRFECCDQETHRTLRNWFAWLEAEVRNAGLEQLHAARHNTWIAPKCKVGSLQSPDAVPGHLKPTIIIKPARGAKYTFHDWKLELDHEQVLERLIYDVYADRSVFIRELIQNALDATRCQMYEDFAAENPGVAPPERPTGFPAEFRERYPVLISLTQQQVKPSPDAPAATREVLTIEDHGTGMNEHIITNYFLQIGRSYYISTEFREQFRFVPTSRFGVGFLSVFAVSRNITVETARRNSATGKMEGLCLKLREPRNYLLTEPWTPFELRPQMHRHGTRIAVALESWREDASATLLELVSEWCVAVEVPIIVAEDGKVTVVRPERMEDKAVLQRSKVDPNARFILRSFDLDGHKVEGQLAIIAYEDKDGEGWCDCWRHDKALAGGEIETVPNAAQTFVALHGILLPWTSQHMSLGYPIDLSEYMSTAYSVGVHRQWIAHADIRSREEISLGRLGHSPSGPGLDVVQQVTHETAQRAVAEHLRTSVRAKGDRGVLYVGEVLSAAPVDDDWREQYPSTVPLWSGGTRHDVSVREVMQLDDLVLAAWEVPRYHQRRPLPPLMAHPKSARSEGVPILSSADLPGFATQSLRAKLLAMKLCEIDRQDDLWLLSFSNTRATSYERTHAESASWMAPLPASVAGFYGVNLTALKTASNEFYVMDASSLMVRWLRLLKEAAETDPQSIDRETVEACWLRASTAWWSISEWVRSWREDPRVPARLKPPPELDRMCMALELVGRHTV